SKRTATWRSSAARGAVVATSLPVIPRFTARIASPSKKRRTFFPRRPTRSIRRPRSRLPRLAGESPGASTSGWRTVTPFTVRPTMLRCRSRAMVSASGSSGMPLQLPPADVPAVLPAFELNGLGGRAAAGRGLLQRARDGGHREHAPARSDEPPVLQPGAGVEDDHVLRVPE